MALETKIPSVHDWQYSQKHALLDGQQDDRRSYHRQYTSFEQSTDTQINRRRGQTTIGWQHFSCGRLSSKWQRAFDAHQNERSTADPRARMTPISTLIRKLWDLRQAIWRNRNALKHGKTPEEREQIVWKRLRPQITRAYAAHHSTMTPTARRQLFRMALAT